MQISSRLTKAGMLGFAVVSALAISTAPALLALTKAV